MRNIIFYTVLRVLFYTKEFKKILYDNRYGKKWVLRIKLWVKIVEILPMHFFHLIPIDMANHKELKKIGFIWQLYIWTKHCICKPYFSCAIGLPIDWHKQIWTLYCEFETPFAHIFCYIFLRQTRFWIAVVKNTFSTPSTIFINKLAWLALLFSVFMRFYLNSNKSLSKYLNMILAPENVFFLNWNDKRKLFLLLISLF